VDNTAEWYQLAIGDVISDVKREAARRLSEDFGILMAEISADEVRIDVMQNADRKSDSYRIFITKRALSAFGRPSA